MVIDCDLRKWGLASLLLAILTIAACSQKPLYKFDPGPFEVTTIDEVTLHDSVQGRDVTLRVLYPDGAGPFPVVVYSTGMFCYPQMYDRVTAHWVSHGYVVVQPNHLDSPNNAKPPTLEQLDIVLPSRVRDVSFVLDALDEIGERADIEAKIDSQRLAIAGHSFGAVIAMIKTGLYLKDEYKGPFGEVYDQRFEAAVLMSGVGRGMEQMADNAFDGLRRPLMATGGTRDVGRVDLGELTPAEWRRQPFLLAPPGGKYSVITKGTDHYMGGLICNEERGENPDYEAVAIVRAMTTAFLDAHIKHDTAAQNFLNTVDVPASTNGKARYQYR
jgi:pimeloyl-ACP methyl ester carboxylesterase